MNCNAAPIVLLHGWGFLPDIWSPVVNALRQRGVVAPILTPALPLSDNLSQVSAIESLFNSLPETAHLVGWSLGGELALAYTRCFPERVCSLTLISSTPCFMHREDWTLGQPVSLLDDFDQRLKDNPAALLKRFSTLIRHGDPAASRDKSLTENMQACADTDAERLATGLTFLRTLDLREACHKDEDQPPVTLIHGEADSVVPLAAAQWLAQELKGQLIRIEAASHALPLTHADQIAETLAGSL